MKISGKYFRSLNRILAAAGSAERVRFSVLLDDIPTELRVTLGFDESQNVGDYLVPSVIGKYTSFNANGDVKVRKDLSKRPESIMFYGASRDWRGGVHYGVKTRTVDKYPREYIAAPSETLEIIHLGGRRYISSAELNLNEADEKRNIHVANMMLECFSAFEVFDICKNKIIGPKLKRLQWDVLPSGKYPWAESKGVINKAASKLDRKGREVIEHRMRVISKLNPNFLATGRAGFSGYFVYGFEGPNVYVLESVYLDNATYVFDSDWEKLSGLTKNEIINGSIPHKRIVHNQRWSVEVGRAIHKK